MKITGHSARRSGALFYIRSGYALEQVKFLGRWKSDWLWNTLPKLSKKTRTS